MNCQECGLPLAGRHPNARYCDERCKDRARYRRDPEKRRLRAKAWREAHPDRSRESHRTGDESACARCGSKFRPFRDRAGIYCTAECHNEARKAATAARTHKPCSRCGETKPVDEYPAAPGTADGLRAHCRVCERLAQRAYSLRANYGITVDEYEQMLARQNGQCAICGTTECGTGKSFAVDHDHTSGAVRGLLCGSCNLGIGQLGDDPDRLLAAAMYLIRASQRKSANA